MWVYRKIKVRWLGHDSYVIQGSRTVVVDPFQTKGGFTADLLLISHEHSDHLSLDDIKLFVTPTTTVVAPNICRGPLETIQCEKRFVSPGMRLEAKGVEIEAVPAYNTNKFREPGRPFHPKEEGRVGYVFKLDGVRFYHAGDTDKTEEMASLDVDVAFLPVSGTYVMTAEEAAEAAKAIRAKVVVPMHYASIVGSREDAERFERLVGGTRPVEILERE